MGIPQTNFKNRRKPTLGRTIILVMAPMFWRSPLLSPQSFCNDVFMFVFGMCGMKVMTRIMLRSDPKAANSDDVCSLEKNEEHFYQNSDMLKKSTSLFHLSLKACIINTALFLISKKRRPKTIFGP